MKKIIKSWGFLKSPVFYRRLGIIVLMLLIIARFTVLSEESKREMSNLNVWFVVDATGSMVAKDVNNHNKRRFEQTQDDTKDIVLKLPGSKNGVIVQDFSTYSVVPMTLNADSVIASTPYFKPKNSYHTRPSNFTELFTYVTERVAKYKERYPECNNVIVFMSDGEDVSGESIEIPQDLPDLIDGAIVLGYGSTDGSLIEIVGDITNDGFDYTAIANNNYVTYFGDDPNISVDSRYRVISKINEENLQQIANTLNGNYYHRENGTVPDSVINTLSSVADIKHSTSDDTTNTGAETYWIFAILLLVLLAWEGGDILTRILTERSRKNA